MITRRRIIRRLLAAGRTQDKINDILADLKMRPFGLPEFKDPPPAPNWDRWMMLRRPQDWKHGKTLEEIIQIEKQFGIYGEYAESGKTWVETHPPPPEPWAHFDGKKLRIMLDRVDRGGLKL